MIKEAGNLHKVTLKKGVKALEKIMWKNTAHLKCWAFFEIKLKAEREKDRSEMRQEMLNYKNA